jgi:pyruvate,water dikinase
VADHILSLDDTACHSTDVAGGKGASLGRMRAAGLPVPPGFVVTAGALSDSLIKSGVAREVRDLIASLGDGTEVSAVASRIQAIVRSAPPWEDLAGEIAEAYQDLGDDIPVAVRSSACAEDSESASFAGQQESFLNISGSKSVLENVVECWASYFSERALFYRQKKASLADLGMAVVVQRQIASDKSGVMFTIDPIRRRNDQMVIEAVFGLGEAVVSGLVTPDNYVVRKSGAVKRVRIGRQDRMIVRDDEDGTRTLTLDEEKATSQVLDEDEIARLVAVGLQLENGFGAPQDIEWALESDELYVLQSRPITA